MKQLDFLFIYEHKVRELENLCLMKYELDRRGYKTEIIYINDAENALSPKILYKTKVLCTMACYHNKTLRWHVKDFIEFEKIIDLQWENIVYPKDEHRVGAYKNYHGIGKDVVRVSWGKQNETRLLETAQMDPEKVKVIGHVGMDFLRYPLSRYYISRKELIDKYGIEQGKKVILFASPYYGDNLSQQYIDDMCNRFGDNWVDYYYFMCESQKIVLKWFEQLCTENKDTIIIFRPHPGHPSLMADAMAEKYENFKVIGSESVKQWIVSCDKVFTGNSSVVVEAFFAKKDCQLLFPLETTDGFELKLIEDSTKIRTYSEFEKAVGENNNPFPTPRESIEEIYLVDWKEPSYIKFANMAEEVLNSNYYCLSKKQLTDFKEYSIWTKIIKKICKVDFVYNVYLKLLNSEKFHSRFIENQRKIRAEVYAAQKADAHELTSEQEIQKIIERITYALEGEKENE